MPTVQPANNNAAENIGATRSSTVYHQLRHDIIVGSLKPGSRLNINALCLRFDTALSPVREALNRLAPEGLVHKIDNRGFVVAPVSVEEMNDLTMARCWLNETALRDAIAHGDTAWEEAVIVALHRLTRTRRDETNEAQQDIWSEVHRAFHNVLISACRSATILRYCDETFVASERYRHIARRSGKRRLDKDTHGEIAQAAIDRKADLAVELLNQHFKRTGDHVKTMLGKQGDS